MKTKRTRIIALALAGGLILGGAGTLAGDQGVSQVTLEIEGVYCISCSDILQVGLERLDGVKAAVMDIEKGTITVRYIEGKVTLTRIVEEINKLSFLGFKVKLPVSKKAPDYPNLIGCCSP